MDNSTQFQMASYFEKIDKVAAVIRIILTVVFLIGLAYAQKIDDRISVIELILGFLVVYLIVAVKASTLKQKAMIRWIQQLSK